MMTSDAVFILPVAHEGLPEQLRSRKFDVRIETLRTPRGLRTVILAAKPLNDARMDIAALMYRYGLHGTMLRVLNRINGQPAGFHWYAVYPMNRWRLCAARLYLKGEWSVPAIDAGLSR
jgi:hypothetical protein